MNIKKSLYWSVAGAFLLAACTPDDHSLSMPDLQPADLVQGKAYTVDVDAQNTITLKSLLDKSYNCYWIHPNGRAQGNVATLALPFAGTYEVTFGVDTRGGVVYGAPYQFQINTNNMSLLEDHSLYLSDRWCGTIQKVGSSRQGLWCRQLHWSSDVL